MPTKPSRRSFLLAAVGVLGGVWLRAGETKQLDAGAGDSDAPLWQQIALEGEYKGHSSGEFILTQKVFDEIVRNFRAHPSYRADPGRTDVIPWDFHHANESPAAKISVAGAPAQGWAQELEVRPGPLGCELWALTRWLEPARSYIKAGQYKWASIAIWPDSKDAKTGRKIGMYLSSIALTNDPFIQGMLPLAAEADRAGTPALAAPPATPPPPKKTRSQTMSLKTLVKIASLLKLEPSVIVAAREEDAASVHALEGQVLAEAGSQLQQATQMAQQLAALLASMGVPASPPPPPGAVASRVVQLMKAESDLKELGPKILELEKSAAAAKDAAITASVDNLIAAQPALASARTALLAYRAQDQAAFEKEYPPQPPMPGGFSHLLHNFVTPTPGHKQQAGNDPFAGARVVNGQIVLAGHQPQNGQGAPLFGPALFGGQPAQGQLDAAMAAQVVDIQAMPGRNALEQVQNFVLSKNPEAKRDYNALHAKSCDLLTKLRAAGAQL